MLNVIQLTRQLVDIPSVTGEEGAVGKFLFSLLQEQGWTCRLQEVAAGRFNVLAVRGRPEVLLTTHMDTVPPFVPSQEDDRFVYGRGACDAKGIAAAMMTAGAELVRQGVHNLGLLFLVGEETDSAGALKAQDLGITCSFLIDGEPTDNELVIAHKGILYARVRTRGVAAHSAYPERGISAVDKLLLILERLGKTDFPRDALLGESFVNVGKLQGGEAANVIADRAEAEVLIRTVTESRIYVELLERAVGEEGATEIIRRSEPQRLDSVDGFSTKVVAYGTDIPALRVLGTPLLFGPGSVLDAHTDGEKISKKQLTEAVGYYQVLVRKLKKGKG